MASPSLPRTASEANNCGGSSTTPPVAEDSFLLPEHLLYEILPRLPAKPLCRLRAVCRSWRSLVSDSSFVAAHKARHHHLLVADFRLEMSVAARQVRLVDFHILDSSGQRVRQMRFDNPQEENLYWELAYSNHDQLLCLVGADKHAYVIDPATGVFSLLPDEHLEQYENCSTRFALGRSFTTGETKVLAMAQSYGKAPLCKILTLDDAAGEWRETGSPPPPPPNSFFVPCSKLVALVKGILYLLAYDYDYSGKHIVTYNLDEENWRPDLLHLPLPVMPVKGAIALAELSDSLVVVYGPNNNPNHTSDVFIDLNHTSDVFMDLWYLTDAEKVVWSKRYTIAMPYQGCQSRCEPSWGYPLWELDDGRIVLWLSLPRYWNGQETRRQVKLLRVYDPRTNTCTDQVEMSGHAMIGVYKGSLLAGLP
ncbi:hypothetical protein VPH35_071627 [Triticum aestivum]